MTRRGGKVQLAIPGAPSEKPANHLLHQGQTVPWALPCQPRAPGGSVVSSVDRACDTAVLEGPTCLRSSRGFS